MDYGWTRLSLGLGLTVANDDVFDVMFLNGKKKVEFSFFFLVSLFLIEIMCGGAPFNGCVSSVREGGWDGAVDGSRCDVWVADLYMAVG